jgi:hypothetical protein
VRIEDDRVGRLDPGQGGPAAAGELKEPAVGAVGVEPEILPGRELAERADRVDGPGLGAAGVGDEEERPQPGGPVLGDHAGGRAGVHPQAGGDRHDPDPGRREPGDPRGLRHAVVGVRRYVERPAAEVLAEPVVTGGHDRRQGGHRPAGGDQAAGRPGEPELAA